MRRVGARVHPLTRKLVCSFADLDTYARVRRNLRAAGIPAREFTPEEMRQTATAIGDLCRRWGIAAATCGEAIDLAACGVAHNACIDADLLLAP